MRAPYAGLNGNGRSDDGSSRQFDDATKDPRHVVARTLAEYDGWAEIRPGHWAEAGRVVKALKAAEMLAGRRKPGGAA